MCILQDAWLSTNPPEGGTILPEGNLGLIVLGYYVAQSDTSFDVGPEARAILDSLPNPNLSGILCPLTEAWCESEWIDSAPTTEGLRVVCFGYALGLAHRDLSKLGRQPFKLYLQLQHERKRSNEPQLPRH
jgi:hypothetical protein